MIVSALWFSVIWFITKQRETRKCKCALVFHYLVYEKKTTEQQAETRKCKCVLVFHYLIYEKKTTEQQAKHVNVSVLWFSIIWFMTKLRQQNNRRKHVNVSVLWFSIIWFMTKLRQQNNRRNT